MVAVHFRVFFQYWENGSSVQWERKNLNVTYMEGGPDKNAQNSVYHVNAVV